MLVEIHSSANSHATPMARSKTQTKRSQELRDDSASEPYSDELNVSSPSILDTAEGGNVAQIPSDESEEPSEDENEAIKQRLSTVSFGALAKAQKLLANGNEGSRKRKRTDGGSQEAEEKLRALRDRLRELQNATQGGKESSKSNDPKKTNGSKSHSKEAGRVQAYKSILVDDMRDASSEDDSGEQDEEVPSSDSSDHEDPKKPHRKSKHAPTEMSTKHAVSRKRTIIDVPKSTSRDPRFDPLTGPLNADAIKKKYAFLNDYQNSELAELKAALKSNKKKLSEAERENLKKKILSIESRRKADEAREKEKEIKREHRRREKELVRQGKKPFFLKKSEVKKQVLVKKFEGMKGRERENVVERRRRKLAARERRNIPDTRRG